MNILIDKLPKEVTYGGAVHPINWDFRTALLFEQLMDEPELSDEEKLVQALVLFFPELPQTETEALESVEKLMWFYKCGKELSDWQKNKAESDNVKRVYDSDYDDDYIYAAFMQQYHIDLTEANLHWWQYRAMFKALTDQTEFVKIMGYRGIDIDDKMTKEQKAHYKKLKKIYELPRPKDEQERLDAITQALLGDGKISGLIV